MLFIPIKNILFLRIIDVTVLSIFFIVFNIMHAYANSGMENISYSAKSAGMGGTSIAAGSDTTVMNTNPAAISKIDGRRIDMNMELMFPMFSFKNPVNNSQGNHPIYLIPSAGFVWHKAESKWAFGLGMFADENAIL